MRQTFRPPRKTGRTETTSVDGGTSPRSVPEIRGNWTTEKPGRSSRGDNSYAATRGRSGGGATTGEDGSVDDDGEGHAEAVGTGVDDGCDGSGGGGGVGDEVQDGCRVPLTRCPRPGLGPLPSVLCGVRPRWTPVDTGSINPGRPDLLRFRSRRTTSHTSPLTPT